MNPRPDLARLSVPTKLVAAMISVVTSAGLLGAVTAMFERAGTPLARIVVAERASSKEALAKSGDCTPTMRTDGDAPSAMN